MYKKKFACIIFTLELSKPTALQGCAGQSGERLHIKRILDSQIIMREGAISAEGVRLRGVKKY